MDIGPRTEDGNNVLTTATSCWGHHRDDHTSDSTSRVNTGSEAPEMTTCAPAVSKGGKGEKPQRTKRRLHGQMVCWVCGDRAVAHNFGALTCETCKAFFRRNANRAQVGCRLLEFLRLRSSRHAGPCSGYGRKCRN